MASQHHESIGRLFEQFKEDSRELDCLTRKLKDAGETLERISADLKSESFENACRYLEDKRAKGEAPSSETLLAWLKEYSSLSRKVQISREDLHKKHGIKCIEFDL